MARYSRCVGPVGETRQSTLCAISRTRTNSNWTLPFLVLCCIVSVSGCFPMLAPHFPVLGTAPHGLCAWRSPITRTLLLLLPSSQATPEIHLWPLPVAHEHQQPDLQWSICHSDEGQGNCYSCRYQGNLDA